MGKYKRHLVHFAYIPHNSHNIIEYNERPKKKYNICICKIHLNHEVSHLFYVKRRHKKKQKKEKRKKKKFRSNSISFDWI